MTPTPEEIAAGCICGEKFVEPGKLCPVHYSPPPGKEFKEDEVMIITDANLAPHGIATITGLPFTCPKCKKDAIIANDFMGNGCINCLTPVKLQSEKYTKLMRDLYKK